MIHVIDNFLSPEDFLSIQKEALTLEYKQVNLGDDPYYKLDSGIIHKSARKYWSNKEHSFEVFFDNMLARNIPSNIFSLMVHVYQPGAELSWHNDGHLKGAYTFYIHNEWRSEWNGQLLISDQVLSENPAHNVLEHRQDVMSPGTGRYIEPVPNRLVIIEGDYIHKVVRPLHTRKSFTGFFQ